MSKSRKGLKETRLLSKKMAADVEIEQRWQKNNRKLGGCEFF